MAETYNRSLSGVNGERVGYHVSCAECGLDETLHSVDDVLDRQAEHRRERSDAHVLEFEIDR